MKLKNIFLYDENRKNFGKKTCHRILNMALIESRTDPDVNLRRIPYVSSAYSTYQIRINTLRIMQGCHCLTF